MRTYCDARDYLAVDPLDKEADHDVRRTANALERVVEQEELCAFYMYRPIIERTLDGQDFDLFRRFAEGLKHESMSRSKRKA